MVSETSMNRFLYTVSTLVKLFLDEKGQSCSKGTKCHTHASEASKTVPIVQKKEKITIQVPRFPAGTNSKNQDENTCPLSTPMPTKNRRASKQK